MGYLNRVILLGNCTRSPEVRFIPGRDLPVAKFGLAVTKRMKDREDTCFIDIVTFGKTAEMCGEYVTKGMPLLIEGRLQYSTWEAEGQKRSKHEVVAENIQFVAKKDGSKDYGSGAFDAPNGGGIDESDIPFLPHEKFLL